MRSALHELLHIGDAGQSVLDDALVLVREMRFATRLLEKSGVGKVGHHVANRSRTQTFAAGASKRAGPHRLSAGNECLDDGGQDFAFSSAGWPCWHIYPSLGAEALL